MFVFALSLVFGDGGQCVGGVNFFCPSWLVGRSVGLGQGQYGSIILRFDSNFGVSFFYL